MNDRYQTDGPKGQTKKSASSLKPKSKAASSVYVKSTQKTPQEKKAAQKAARQKQAELDRKYYNPAYGSYKKVQTHLVGHARRRYRLRWSPWALAPGGPITRL